MNIEDLKNLGVSEETANEIIALSEKALADKESELEMASEKIKELSVEIETISLENKKLSDKRAELSEEIGALEEENEKLLADKQLADESPRTVDMGLKHGAAASGNQFGFRFTGVRPANNS